MQFSKYTWILAVVFALVWGACNNKGEDPGTVNTPNDTPNRGVASPVPNNVTTEALTFIPKTVSRKKGDEVNFDVQYLEAKGGENGVAEAINDTLMNYLYASINYSDEEAENASVEKYADLFVEQAMNEHWMLEVRTEVTHQTKELITITIDAYEYTGGAHPNGYSVWLNFDLNTGKSLEWDAFLTDKQKLLPFVLKKMRTTFEIPENESFLEFGFFIGEEEFVLPANFGLQNDTLIAFYNTYEVGPYVMGPAMLAFSKEELGDLAKW